MKTIVEMATEHGFRAVEVIVRAVAFVLADLEGVHSGPADVIGDGIKSELVWLCKAELLPVDAVGPIGWNEQFGAKAKTSDDECAGFNLSGALVEMHGEELRHVFSQVPAADLSDRAPESLGAAKRAHHDAILAAAARRILSGKNCARAFVALENYRHDLADRGLIGFHVHVSWLGKADLQRIASLDHGAAS